MRLSIALIVLSLTWSAVGEEGAELRPLRGLDRVTVSVQLNAAAQQAGLRAEDIKQSIETKLRKAGLTLSPKLEQNTSLVHVTVELVDSEELKAVHAYAIALHIIDSVTVARTAESQLAVTWSEGAIGLAGSNKVISGPLSALDATIEGFLNNLQKANSSKSRGPDTGK